MHSLFEAYYLPMFRHITEPGDTGGFEFDVGVKSSDDGAVDDDLFLLIEQPDQFPLGADYAVDLPVRVIQKPYDGRLFVGRRCQGLHLLELSPVEPVPILHDAA